MLRLWTVFSLLFIFSAIAGLVIITAAYNEFGNSDPLAFGVFICKIIVLPIKADCDHFFYFEVFVIVFSIYLIYFLAVLGVSILLIIGTKQKDHTKLMPFMILMIIGIVIAILQMFTVFITGIIIGIITIMIDTYFFICTYSLYDKFRNEKMDQINSRVGNPYVYPQQTVIYSAHPPTYGQPQIVIESPTATNTPDIHAQATAPSYEIIESMKEKAKDN